MNARARLITYLATVLLSTALAIPASSEDIFIEWPFSDGSENVCGAKTYKGYTVDVASFMDRHDPDLCGKSGPWDKFTVYATMTRYASRDEPRTVTSTIVCPVTVQCDSWVSMPHPNIEEADYELTWESYGYWNGRWYWAGSKWVWTQCGSKVIIAECPQHWAIRVPDR